MKQLKFLPLVLVCVFLGLIFRVAPLEFTKKTTIDFFDHASSDAHFTPQAKLSKVKKQTLSGLLPVKCHSGVLAACEPNQKQTLLTSLLEDDFVQIPSARAPPV